MTLAIISHRCRGFDAEENTLAALKKALASKVDAIEIDVRLTKDKRLIVWHDTSYRDERGKKHVIADETLVNAVLHGKMPLETTLATFKRLGKEKVLQIDVKTVGYEEPLVRMIRKHHLERQILIVSWIGAVLERVHALAPELKLSFSFAQKVWTSYEKGVPFWFALRLPYLIRNHVVPLETVNIVPFVRISWFLVWRLRRRGINVVVVNVDDEKGNARLERLGVWGTMTNEPREILEYLEKQG